MGDEQKQRPRFVQDARMQWYFDHKAELERDHAGEWVAIGPEGLLAWGSDLVRVKQEAQDRGAVRPLLTGVQAKEFQGKVFIRVVQ